MEKEPMRLLRGFIDRLFKLDIDAYYLFRDDFSSLGDIPDAMHANGFEFILCDSAESLVFDGLSDLWIAGGYHGCGHRDKVVEFLVDAFGRGDICLLVLANGVPAGMMWASGPRSRLLSKFAACVANDCTRFTIHRTYIAPQFRGKGLQRSMNWFLKVRMAERGFKGSYGFVGPKNLASVSNNMKTCQEYKLIYHLTIEVLSKKFNFYPKFRVEPWIAVIDRDLAQV
jgi:hypothetical protein